jgi:hypothetical protein
MTGAILRAPPRIIAVRSGAAGADKIGMVIIGDENTPLKEIGYGSFKQIQKYQLWSRR